MGRTPIGLGTLQARSNTLVATGTQGSRRSPLLPGIDPVCGRMGLMRILVVEDRVELADDIAEGLRDRGMAADVAYDGTAGMEKALMNRYDVVVLDRDLPKVHGDAVCAALVRSPS